jgi:hypothetical protein
MQPSTRSGLRTRHLTGRSRSEIDERGHGEDHLQNAYQRNGRLLLPLRSLDCFCIAMLPTLARRPKISGRPWRAVNPGRSCQFVLTPGKCRGNPRSTCQHSSSRIYLWRPAVGSHSRLPWGGNADRPRVPVWGACTWGHRRPLLPATRDGAILQKMHATCSLRWLWRRSLRLLRISGT